MTGVHCSFTVYVAMGEDRNGGVNTPYGLCSTFFMLIFLYHYFAKVASVFKECSQIFQSWFCGEAGSFL